tara:strand:+ start:196 stop:795 length:600 start_codon:yes stop_codon:yes gene_type:complete
MKLHKILLTEQDIHDLIKSYAISLKKNSIMKQDRYKSMIWVRLADLGFNRHHITKMTNDLEDVSSEKDIDSFMSRYRLWGDDYVDSFRATESTITEVEREEDEDGVEENIHTFDLLLQIPFTTEKNKDQKIRKLKFDLMVLDIKVNSQKELEVDKINPEAEQNPALDFVVKMQLKTEMTRSQLENELEPDYKILKLKEV